MKVSKRNFISLILISVLILSGGSFYLINGIYKSKFLDGCTRNLKSVTENFSNYKSSTNKPGIFEDDVSPNTYLSKLRLSLGAYEEIANSNTFYSGARKSKKLLEELNLKLQSFVKIKSKLLNLETSNPNGPKLRAWSIVAKNSVYESLLDDGFSNRLAKIGQEYENQWDLYMDKYFKSADYLDLRNKSTEVDTTIAGLSAICREAS